MLGEDDVGPDGNIGGYLSCICGVFFARVSSRPDGRKDCFGGPWVARRLLRAWGPASDTKKNGWKSIFVITILNERFGF